MELPEEADAFLITSAPNYIYLSGFTGSNCQLLITRSKGYIITDFRYYEQAAVQASAFQLEKLEGVTSGQKMKELLARENISCLGVEGDHMVVSEWLQMEKSFEDIKILPLSGLVERIRQIKDSDEQEKLRQASSLAVQAFNYICEWLRPGVSEKETALELETYMRRHGAESLSFASIVVSGARGSLPHGVPTDKIISKGELVTMDFGCQLNGYCSDMTRTVAVGHVSDEQKQVYNIVLKAQMEALAGIASGMLCSEADALARNIIADFGYKEYFGHGLGHGVGMEVHELPGISPRSDAVLAPGMAVTVEPGIYIPNRLGVRIEDLVIVKESGIENLVNCSKDLIEI